MQRRMDAEIYEHISFLRNLIILGQGGRLPTDAILEELIRCGGSLQPVYSRCLQLLRMNRRREAAEHFARRVDTEMGRDLGRLLLQWDEIAPKDLLETLLSHQKNLKEIRLTEQKRRNETLSDLLYLPVVLNVMLVFLNFIYVAFLIDQRAMLGMFL
jgi:hypothetical protein